MEDENLPKSLFRCPNCYQTLFLGIEYDEKKIFINGICEEYHINDMETLEDFLKNNFGEGEYVYDIECNNPEHEGEKLIGFCTQCLCGFCQLCQDEEEHNLHELKLNEDIKLNEIEVNYYKICLNHFEKNFERIEEKLKNLKNNLQMEKLNNLIDNYINLNHMEICFAEEILCQYITHQEINFNYKLAINVRNVLKFNNIVYPLSKEEEDDEDEIFISVEKKIEPFLEDKNNFFLKESKLDYRQNLNIMKLLTERNLNLDMKEEKDKLEFKYLRKRNNDSNNISLKTSRRPSLRLKQDENLITTFYPNENTQKNFPKFDLKYNYSESSIINNINDKRIITEISQNNNYSKRNSLTESNNKINNNDNINYTIIANNNINNDNNIEKKVKINMTNGEYNGTINKEGKLDGKGIFYFKNGDIYEGEYKNGIREGKGKYTYKNGEKYEGDFIKGKANGSGIFTYKNGYYYKGEWKNDLKDGKGEYFNGKTKVTTYGIWKKGKRIKNL